MIYLFFFCCSIFSLKTLNFVTFVSILLLSYKIIHYICTQENEPSKAW